MVFEVGETVVYPHHGAAKIEEIKMRTVKGEEKMYLKLKVAQGDLTIEVPAENVDLVGVRDVVGKEGLEHVFDVLRAEFTLREAPPLRLNGGDKLTIALTIRNTGDTLWLNGQTLRAGVVMPGVIVSDERGEIVSEVHGHPMLPRAVAPGQSFAIDIPCPVPSVAGSYTVTIDLVDQQVCWFAERGSQPLVFSLEVR